MKVVNRKGESEWLSTSVHGSNWSGARRMFTFGLAGGKDCTRGDRAPDPLPLPSVMHGVLPSA
jgi:hypothetical protein